MISVNKLKHHLKHLKEKHALLESKIQDSFNHYDTDETVKQLKLNKLDIKQEIENCELKIKALSVKA